MKKTILLLASSLLIALAGYSQNIPADKVPAAVKQSFTKKFPAATDVKYEIETRDFEITFKDKGIAMSANFDATGKWLETETKINESALPKEVSASVSKNFKGFKISELVKTDTPDKGLIYEMNLKNDKEGYEVQFNPKGEMVKKESLKKSKEDAEKG